MLSGNENELAEENRRLRDRIEELESDHEEELESDHG
jgi:hypothetical protein